MTKQKLLDALEELVSAHEDALRRYWDGNDERAIESNALSSTLGAAKEVIRLSRQEIALGEF